VHINVRAGRGAVCQVAARGVSGFH
jgi:hypothetical protein